MSLSVSQQKYSFQRNNRNNSSNNRQPQPQFSDSGSVSASEDNFDDEERQDKNNYNRQQDNRFKNHASTIKEDEKIEEVDDEREHEPSPEYRHQLGYKIYKALKGDSLGRQLKRHTLYYSIFYLSEGLTLLVLSILEGTCYNYLYFLKSNNQCNTIYLLFNSYIGPCP